MAEEIRPELLSFLTPSKMPYHILVVESLAYLPELRQSFPNAELYAVAENAMRFEAYEGIGVHFTPLDYLSEPLPFPHATFDLILSELALEEALNPQDIAAGFSLFLKETGSLLTSFRNIRYWGVLEELMEGHYYHIATNLFALPEFRVLLSSSYYKNVTVLPQKSALPEKRELLERLEGAGFASPEDLRTEFYLVKADRSMPELAALKSMYTAEERKELSRLLHRVEYDVDVTSSVKSLWALYDRLHLSAAYTSAFINEAVFHHERFYRHLYNAAPERRETILALLQEGKSQALSPKTVAELMRAEEKIENTVTPGT